VIQGRLFDLQGRPAQGVTVSVWAIQPVLLQDPANSDFLRRPVQGTSYSWDRVNDLPAWPKPATTDANGRFSVHGVGRGMQTSLSIIDSRFALQMFEVKTDNSPDAKSVTTALRPAQIIIGRVTYADTGKPVPHAPLSVWDPDQNGGQSTNFQTDADGRFRVNPSSGDKFYVAASAPAGQPYLGTSKGFEWPKGAIEHSLDLSLPRGVMIRGKVTEQGSNHPVAGASVYFNPRRGNDYSSHGGGRAKTLADGSFGLAGASRPGYLAVLGPDDDYRLQEINSFEFIDGRPGGFRIYSHAFIPCDPKLGGAGLEVNVSLRKGVTVTGRIVGPDNQPIPDTWIISRIAPRPSPSGLFVWFGDYHGNARNGRFELHGLNPDSEVPVYFLEPKRKLGATVRLSGKSAADEPLTVRLQPCGTAQARLVDPDGQPLAGYKAPYLIEIVVTPGAAMESPDPADRNRLWADAAPLTRIDSINYLNGPTPDAQGRIVFPALIPGASYRISARARARQPTLHKHFTVMPGETRDLGDIVIEKPQS
jgi:hypothetical protein